MKEATIIIDRDELDKLLREHLAGMFPALEIESVRGLGFGDVTVILRRPSAPIEPATFEPPPEMQPKAASPEAARAALDDKIMF